MNQKTKYEILVIRDLLLFAQHLRKIEEQCVGILLTRLSIKWVKYYYQKYLRACMKIEFSLFFMVIFRLIYDKLNSLKEVKIKHEILVIKGLVLFAVTYRFPHIWGR